MSSSNVNGMVKEAIRVMKAGNKAEARKLLEKATELDPYNEQAWLWLSGVVESDDDQRTCLNNVLLINPGNAHAKQGMAMLDAKIAARTPDRSVIAPEDSPFAGLGDLPKGDNLLDELEAMRAESTSTGSVLPFSAADLDEMTGDFGSFDDEFDDPFADNQAGPFTASPFTMDVDVAETPLDVPQKRSQLEESADSLFSNLPDKPTPKKRRTVEVEAPRIEVETLPGGVAQLFRMIPKEIKPTRMPGTDASTPFIYRVLVLLLALVDIGAAILTFSKILAPINGGQG